MKNYYEILQVKNFAEPEVIKASYKALSLKYHPDVNPTAAPGLMVEINEAYEILKDPVQREAYDSELKKQTGTSKSQESSTDYFHQESTVKEEPITPHFQSEPKTKAGKIAQTIGRGLWTAVDAFLDGARELQKEAENAYYQGQEFDNWELVKKYMRSTGPKRHGYSKVLIQRGLLREENGELVPNYEFKNIARYM